MSVVQKAKDNAFTVYIPGKGSIIGLKTDENVKVWRKLN